MTLRRLGWIAFTIVLLVWIVRNPNAAGSGAQMLGHFATRAADALSKMVGN